MNKEKQIEEMAKDLENYTCMSEFQAEIASRMLYNAGHRKAPEVAREIFEEIEKSVANIKYTVDSPRYTHIPVETMVEVCNWILQECIPKRIAELKKKYTEEGK